MDTQIVKELMEKYGFNTAVLYENPEELKSHMKEDGAEFKLFNVLGNRLVMSECDYGRAQSWVDYVGQACDVKQAFVLTGFIFKGYDKPENFTQV